MEKITIPVELVNKMISKIAERPYVEVADLIALIYKTVNEENPNMQPK